MTRKQSTNDSTELAAPVTGVARGGHGTGTALEDTQLYDVSDFSPVPPAMAQSASQPSNAAAQPLPTRSVAAPAPEEGAEPESSSPTPAEPGATAAAPVAVAPVAVAPVASATAATAAAGAAAEPRKRTPVPSRVISTSRIRRIGAPAAGLAGFALAAGLAVLIGLMLGGVPMPDGAAAGGETARPTATAELAQTEPPKDDDDKKKDGDGGGRGNGAGNSGNGNGRGNGNNDDD